MCEPRSLALSPPHIFTYRRYPFARSLIKAGSTCHKMLTQSRGAGRPHKRPSYGVCFSAARRDFLVFISGLVVVQNILAINSRNSRFGGFNSRLGSQKFPFGQRREFAATV
jgi:hypothetical protein